MIDPALCTVAPASESPQAASQESAAQTFGNDASSVVNAVTPTSPRSTPAPGVENTPLQTRPPKPSSFSHDIIEKAHASIQAVPKKQTLGETLMDIQRYYLSNQSLSFAEKRCSGRMLLLYVKNPDKSLLYPTVVSLLRSSSLGSGPRKSTSSKLLLLKEMLLVKKTIL
jgi:hypothetical protein